MNKSLLDIIRGPFEAQAREHVLRSTFANDTINAMTPLELLKAISDALEEMNRQSAGSARDETDPAYLRVVDKAIVRKREGSTVIREPTRASGGVTGAELRLMKDCAQVWTLRALRLAPIEPEKIARAVGGLYRVAGLAAPRVVVVSSPLVMAFAYGAAAALWYTRTAVAGGAPIPNAYTYSAVQAATHAGARTVTDGASYGAAFAATAAATDADTRDAARTATDAAVRTIVDAATRLAVRDAVDAAVDAARISRTIPPVELAPQHAPQVGARLVRDAVDAVMQAPTDICACDAVRCDDVAGTAALACWELAGDFGLACAAMWGASYQGGNMWAPWECYLSAMRDVIGLRLPEYDAYLHWEEAAVHGGFRVMHEKFCMVCDFPERLLLDRHGRPHCDDGPSHRWRDGWSLYYWHGVRVPPHWIENREALDAAEVLAQASIEQQRAGMQIINAARSSG